MYRLTTSRVTAPTDEINALRVQREGKRLFRDGNSFLRVREDAPLSFRTHSMIPNRGLTSIMRWTWSGMISISRISNRYFSLTSLKISLSRTSIPSVNTRRLYLGQKITWYWQAYTRCSERLYFLVGPAIFIIDIILYIYWNRKIYWLALILKKGAPIPPHEWIRRLPRRKTLWWLGC